MSARKAIFSLTTRKVLLVCFLCLATVASVYHCIGVFYDINNSPAWRHALFVLINLICIYGFIKRPRYFLWFFTALVVQQYYSHGSFLINMWLHQHTIHWISVAVLLLLPFALIWLIDNYRVPAVKS